MLVDSSRLLADGCSGAEKITPQSHRARPHLRASGGHGPVDGGSLAHGVAVIEDAAEAHGGEYGPALRRFGDAATFSFYGNKIITTGEGGMVTTNNAEIAG